MSHTHDKSSALGQGVVIFVYLTVLTILEFFVAVTFNAVSILLVVAVIKAALVMYYYMHIYKLNNDDGTDENSYTYKTGTNRIGLMALPAFGCLRVRGLIGDALEPAGFTRPHQLDQNLGLLVTAVLLISSFFMNRGETAMAHGDVKSFMNNTLITGASVWLLPRCGLGGMASGCPRGADCQFWQPSRRSVGRRLLHDDGYACLPRPDRVDLPRNCVE
jgi:heme/copper-type cytochrome/quinol oxidase subunit 3